MTGLLLLSHAYGIASSSILPISIDKLSFGLCMQPALQTVYEDLDIHSVLSGGSGRRCTHPIQPIQLINVITIY